MCRDKKNENLQCKGEKKIPEGAAGPQPSHQKTDELILTLEGGSVGWMKLLVLEGRARRAVRSVVVNWEATEVHRLVTMNITGGETGFPAVFTAV